MLPHTYTIALLDLSAEAYDEIADKLRAAGYTEPFGETDGVPFIDLSGIGITRATRPPRTVGA